ncbi:uncharacterized protein C8Q71DRAFT_872362 [Rhodofomes roseus]|uniref:Uncharacterized protein n=1 Tax=Rhodofomes roseus TaxID=34475 RepID=A0ABQ8KBP2_9APHY|nr:uncharacterized protein C8Q71DRAFT_872362 [Rhodofomes roseus]KAH9834401.1 hypothetical protein C8Q71DRAFT_872362 [Rhodofomes roseus]
MLHVTVGRTPATDRGAALGGWHGELVSCIAALVQDELIGPYTTRFLHARCMKALDACRVFAFLSPLNQQNSGTGASDSTPHKADWRTTACGGRHLQLQVPHGTTCPADPALPQFQGNIDEGICNAWFSKGREAELAARVRLNAHAASREPLEDNQHHQHHHAHDHDHPHEHAHVHAHDLSDVDMDADAQLVQTRDGAQEALGRDPDTVLNEVMADAGVEDEDEYADDESEDEIKEYIHNTCNGTLPRHGQTWNYYRFYGRVRKWDGLIALVRVHVKDRGLGMYIFRGYLIGGLNSPAAGARMRRTPM